MVTRHYKLVVSGLVQYNDADKGLEEFLLAHQSILCPNKEATELAIQELEETATDVGIEMQKL